MKIRILALTSAIAALAGCSIIRPPQPAPRALIDVVVSCSEAPVEGAIVSINGNEHATNAAGVARVTEIWRQMEPGTVYLKTNVPDSLACESRPYELIDYDGRDRVVGGDPGPYAVPLKQRPPQPPPLPEKALGEDLLHVQANLCNLPTEGVCQFTPFVISLPKEKRQAWYADQRAAGSTHFTISPTISYPGSPWPSSDLYDQPAAFADFVQELLETPSADGKAFRPIISLDHGECDPRPRIKRTWPRIVAELKERNLEKYVLWSPGWELVRASCWTSADLSFGLELLHSLGVSHLWAHLSPRRASGASNPVEKDDPWQGAESGFYKSHGGQYIEGLLYQTENLVQAENPVNCDVALEDCWLNRLEDVVPRVGNGMNGWRVIRLAVFETVAWASWRGRATQEYARQVATAAQAMCAKYAVKCGHGNGLPILAR